MITSTSATSRSTTHLACIGLVTIALVSPLAGCGQSESAREARTMQEATPQRVRPDGSIQLTDRDRAALGLAVVVATESDLPDSTLRFGRVLSPPSSEA